MEVLESKKSCIIFKQGLILIESISMKKISLVLIFISFGLSLFGKGNSSIKEIDTIKTHDSFESQNSQIVYICTGPYAYAYHSRSDCPGLNNCKGEIISTDISTAVNRYSRKPCCRCWSNIAGNCYDDNSTYGTYGGGGGYDPDAYTYAAIAIITVGAIILANDLYVYPSYSFYKGYSKDAKIPIDLYDKGLGWIFGCRKTFNHSAIEYGASYTTFSSIYNYGSSTYEEKIWGGHINYVQQLLYNKTPYWLKLYIGPTINYVFDFGYGGIIGTEFRLIDRLKIDVRYEYSTQTNQIQAGLIFTFQKEYFWKK